MDLPQTSFVHIEGTTVRYEVNTLAEAKVALKELKLLKKGFGVIKRDVLLRQKEIRAAYTSEVRSRGSMVRGGGGVGKFIRFFQTASRDAKRAQLAADLAPLEEQKQQIEGFLGTIDRLIVGLEANMLTHFGH